MQETSDNLAKSVSVAMITLNEEKAVELVIKNIRRVLGDPEIVIVDSSTDRTAEIATELGCTVIKQFPPKGYGNAMHLALQSASRELIVTLDCDDTYPVDDIPKLVKMLHEQDADIISASRLGKRPDTMPVENYLANVAFCLIAFALTGIWSTDLHTGMRVYRKSVLQNYPYDPSYGALPVELQLGPVMVGYKCVETFIDYRERIGVSKLRKLEGTITTLERIWRCRRFFNGFRSQQIEKHRHLREHAV